MHIREFEISAPELLPLVTQEAVTLVDVRESFEVAAGVLPGAVHIPLGQLMMRADEISHEKPVVVYCAHGIRSLQGASLLLSQGFEGTRSLSGGIVAWMRQGGTTTMLQHARQTGGAQASGWPGRHSGSHPSDTPGGVKK